MAVLNTKSLLPLRHLTIACNSTWVELQYSWSKYNIQVWNLERKQVKMKNGIHPDYKKTVIKCVCGNEIETGSVLDNITVEICSNCHPFYTGQQKILDSEGRVERFKKRYGTK